MIDDIFYGSYNGLADEIVAACGRDLSDKMLEKVRTFLASLEWEQAKDLVKEYIKQPKIPANVYGTLTALHDKRQGNSKAKATGKDGKKHVRVEVFEEWGECEKCRAPIVVVRTDDGKDNPTRHRLSYTCGFCGHSATQTVPAKDIVCDHHQFDVGEPGDLAAFLALKEEVNLWHELGLVESQPNPPTPMSIDVWEQAGRPKTWSPIWDEINKDYLAACRENRLKAYCDDWRVKLENARVKRMRAAS
jgi:hypothetical protein